MSPSIPKDRGQNAFSPGSSALGSSFFGDRMAPHAIDSPLFELFGARCLTWKAWELLIVVVPNPKEKASMIRVGKMEASPSSFSRSLCQVSPSAFQPGFRRANRSIILDMLFLLPVLPSLVIGDLINPINPSSVSSHQM
jgi:hypothetical protein